MKLIVAILYDLFDFTIGRLLFIVPGASEMVGVTLGYLLFGPKAFIYLWELIDVTEQLDGFVPTLTLIALADRREREEAAQVKQGAMVNITHPRQQ